MSRALLEKQLRDTYTFVIYDLNDHCQSAGELPVCKEDNAADLDEPPLRGCNLDLCHAGCVYA